MASTRPRGTARSHDPLAGLTWVRGQGAYVWDDQGRRYLDFVGGYSACSLGHSHPRLIAAAAEQLDRITLAHAANSPARAALEQTLASRLAKGEAPSKVWFTTGGTRAVELAWKIARASRPGGVLRFDLAYHGRSLATACLSDTARSPAITLGSEHDIPPLAFPRSDREGEGLHAACERTLAQAQGWLAHHHDQVSMLLMEPAIGSRGYYFAPPWFCKQLAELAHSYGVLVVSDEIQMGLGRLGAWSVAVDDGWKPDLVVLGKALGGGIVSMGAVVGRDALLDGLEEGIESETYAAMPFSCRIALEVIQTLDDEGWVRSSSDRGREWREHLRAVLPESIALDGRGMNAVLHFPSLGLEASNMARQWCVDLSQAGLLVHLTGPSRDRLALIPPLNASRDVLDEALDLIARKGAIC